MIGGHFTEAEADLVWSRLPPGLSMSDYVRAALLGGHQPPAKPAPTAETTEKQPAIKPDTLTATDAVARLQAYGEIYGDRKIYSPTVLVKLLKGKAAEWNKG